MIETAEVAPPGRTDTFDVACAVATASPKAHSQDRGAVACVEGARAFVVCDGVGAQRHSADVAERACDAARAHLEGRGVPLGVATCAAAAGAVLDPQMDGATTLIVLGADPGGNVASCLVGNGFLLEVDAVQMAGGRRLRAIDLELPHVVYLPGGAALRSFLPAVGIELEVARSWRSVAPGRTVLYLGGSDGIATDEERRVATAPDGVVWKEISRPMATLLATLQGRWPDITASPTPEPMLRGVLDDVLAGLIAHNELDDDATVGALLLRPRAPSDEPPA